jgi:hypothetical protein
VVFTTSAEALAQHEQTLYPDLIVVPKLTSERRWFEQSSPERALLRHTRVDTLIVPEGRAAPASGTLGQEFPTVSGHGVQVWPT